MCIPIVQKNKCNKNSVCVGGCACMLHFMEHNNIIQIVDSIANYLVNFRKAA